MSVQQENRLMLRKLLVIVVMMAGFGFALVPLYKKICEVTGIAQTRTPDSVSVANTQIDRSRTITVEFVANNHQGLYWQFEPLVKTLQVHPGEMGEVVYQVLNNTEHKIVGQAVASYGPSLAGKYFKKLECFCFSQQSVAPKEKRDMPVKFVISPDVPQEINTITLSYTFFDVTKQARSGPDAKGI